MLIHVSLRFFFLTKDGPELKNTKQKDGIHIHCPDLTLTPEEQYILRGYLLQQKLIQNVFDEMGFINAEHDVFDVSAIHRNGWFLYGASKPNNSPYKLQKIYLASTDHDILEEEDIDKYETLDLTYLLSIRFGHEIPTALPVVEISKPEWTALGNMWANGKSTPNTIAFE